MGANLRLHLQLSEQHGLDTYHHFIRRLIVHSQARLASAAAPAAFDTSTSLTFRLLVQETQRLARDPYLSDRFRDGIDKGEGEIFRHFDLVRFADRVGLRPLERLILASSIVSAPVRKELFSQAANIIRMEFDNAVLSLCQHPSFDHADLNPSQVGKLLKNLLSDLPSDVPLLDAQQRQAIIIAAQAKFGAEIIAPFLQQVFPSMRYFFSLLFLCGAERWVLQFTVGFLVGSNFVRIRPRYHKRSSHSACFVATVWYFRGFASCRWSGRRNHIYVE